MQRTSHRPPGLEPAKPLPHPRVPTRRHTTLIHTLGGLPQPFHVRDIAAAVGTGAWSIGIAMNFLVQCGLAHRVAGARGTYRSSLEGQSVARAWSVSEEEGQRALHQVWAETWFAHSARDRLRDGAGLRMGLRLTLLRQVRTPGHEAGVDRLLDLMVATGFLVEEPDDYVRWHEDTPAARPATEADDEPHALSPPPEAGVANPKGTTRQAPRSATHADTGPGRTSTPPGGPPAPAADAATPALDRPAAADVLHGVAAAPAAIPAARPPGDSATGPPPHPAKAAVLLTEEFGMSDVLHLTHEEAAALHDHLTGLLGILSTMHERAYGHADPLNATLLTPWTPAAIAASSREDWLNSHYLVRQLATAAPFRRQPTNT
ncbi:hypothetical protein [Streptomyces adonidis]|uniref:hypothetical protein n=1 Tax=Streptomyces adonidis TaxID=3231367 RepID=UPI0034DACFEC